MIRVTNKKLTDSEHFLFNCGLFKTGHKNREFRQTLFKKRGFILTAINVNPLLDPFRISPPFLGKGSF